MNTTATLGTWTNGTDTLIACFAELGHVRLENSKAEVMVVTDDEWLDRLDNLKDAAWFKAKSA